MSILAHIYKALPFSKSSRIVTALVSVYHVMLISFQPLLCMQAHLNLYLCVWVWVERLHKDSPTQSTIDLVHMSGLEVMQPTGLTMASERGAEIGNFTPVMGPASLKRPGMVEQARATWGVAIVEQEQHDRSHQLYESRQWDVQMSMLSCILKPCVSAGRLSLMKASLS